MLNLKRYRICAIGKVRKKWVREGVAQYQKRLPNLAVTELRDSTLQRESQSILNELKIDEVLVAVTEEGELLSSPALAERLNSFGSQRLVFAIGGADGLAPKIKTSAFWQISLSKLTFPHEIARLLLLEQLYRAHSIIKGSPYHRN